MFDPRLLVGKAGLNRIMKFDDGGSTSTRSNFEYKDISKYGRIFSLDLIGKYSAKIKNICMNVINSTGLILVYSQYIDGGLVPIALALEELGLTRTGNVKSLFKTPPTEKIDAITFKTKDKMSEKEVFRPATYAMITGDKSLSPNNAEELKRVTDPENKDGSKVKIVLISQAGSEGLDFKFIRQVHILEPWYNMNRIEQIIGRAVRTCSHKDLPLEERNVELYLYGSILKSSEEEAADIYVYRLAERKAIIIGRVSRVLKQCSVDCLLNAEQSGFTVEQMNQTLPITLSSKKVIDYAVGDRPYTAICDYMETCQYTCSPNKKIDDSKVKLDSYGEFFITTNADKLLHRIKTLFKEKYVYYKKDLVKHINIVRTYPLEQINSALQQLVEDKNEFIADRYGRLGNVVNIGTLYLFQPLELTQKHISTTERAIPIPFKRETLKFTEPSLVKDATKIMIKNVKPGEKKLSLGETSELQVETPVLSKISSDKDQDESEEQAQELSAYMQARPLLTQLQEKYDTGTTLQVIVRGEDDVYKFWSDSINILENTGVSQEILVTLFVEHLMENLMYRDTLLLLNYLESSEHPKDILHPELKKKIKEYFDARYLQTDKIKGIILINTEEKSGRTLFVMNKSKPENGWAPAQYQDEQDLLPVMTTLVKSLETKKKNLNMIIGFIINFKKEGYMVFKTKDLRKKRNKGARCDQTTKSLASKVLKEIYPEVFDIKKIKSIQICVLQELYLRLFDREKKDGKTWFLSPVEAQISNIENM